MMSPNKALMRRHYSSPKFGLSLATSDPGERGRRDSVHSANMACSLTRSVEARVGQAVIRDQFTSCGGSGFMIQDFSKNCKKFP